jgi:hypothetical protein
VRLALVVVVASAIACGSSTPPCVLPAPGPQGPPFLWKVQHPNGPVIWLYGTIHDAGEDEVPQVAKTALESSKHFASELGDAEPDMKQLAELARLPFGKVLDQMLPADDWWELVDAMRGTMSEDELRHAQPWFAMTRLTSKLAAPPKPSMDDALAARAKQHGIPVDALESWSEQMTALTKAVNVADLQQAIHARKTIACELSKMRALYDAGDGVTLEPLLVVRDQGTLIDARNAKWRAQLESYAVTDGAFVAVGLGHLLGNSGLPAVLARAGFLVERVR